MSIEIDARAVRAGLINDGYVVFRRVVPVALCQAVLDAIGSELHIRVDDPASWGRVSAEIEEVPLRGHQSQWDIRQLPELHAIWSTVWGTERLWVDRNRVSLHTAVEGGESGAAPAPLGCRSARSRRPLVPGHSGAHRRTGRSRGILLLALADAQPRALADLVDELSFRGGVPTGCRERR